MRIGISCYPTHGGSGVVATELGKHLAEYGHEVAFVSYSTPHRLSRMPRGVTFHEVQGIDYPLLKEYPYTLALASKIADVAKMKNLQIIHAHYAVPFAVAAILAKQIVPELNLKVVTTLHGTDVTLIGKDRSFRPIVKLALEQSDHVTVVSDYLKHTTVKEFGGTFPVTRIHNFIDTSKYSRNLCPDNTFNVIHISNFRSVKRIEDVVRAFYRVAQKSEKARLIMVGDGPDCNSAVNLADELGIADKVSFRGIVDEVTEVLAEAHLLLLPSSSESFGLVALEAMAAGLPVVASDVGGLPEVVEHGVTGFLAGVGEVDLMADYILKLINDRDKYSGMAHASGKRAAALFSYEKIVPEYMSLYESLIEG